MVSFSSLVRNSSRHERTLFERHLDQIPVAAGGDNHLVRNLPRIPAYSYKHWAGYIDVYNHGVGYLFYWLFESHTNPQSAPLVIWLNGGPGCSSMEGAFLEYISPFSFGDTPTLIPNPYTWVKSANVLFLDQPIGTGLSYTMQQAYAVNMNEVVSMFHQFMVKFLNAYPAFKNRDLYLLGESFAGTYIPYFVDILQQNPLEIRVKGIGINSGWIDPKLQNKAYIDFAFSHGIISEGQKAGLNDLFQQCSQTLDFLQVNGFPSPFGNADSCRNLFDIILSASTGVGMPMMNIYDIRLFAADAGDNYPNTGRLKVFLDDINVRRAIHTESCPVQWQECSDLVYSQLDLDSSKSSLATFQNVLRRDPSIRVLLTYSQFDFICNHLGGEQVYHSLKQSSLPTQRSVWVVDTDSNVDEPNYRYQAQYQPWTFRRSTTVSDRKLPGGYVETDGKLSFMIAIGAGHMIPMDHPNRVQDLIERFLSGRPLSDALQLNLPEGIPNRNNQVVAVTTTKTVTVTESATNTITVTVTKTRTKTLTLSPEKCVIESGISSSGEHTKSILKDVPTQSQSPQPKQTVTKTIAVNVPFNVTVTQTVTQTATNTNCETVKLSTNSGVETWLVILIALGSFLAGSCVMVAAIEFLSYRKSRNTYKIMGDSTEEETTQNNQL